MNDMVKRTFLFIAIVLAVAACSDNDSFTTNPTATLTFSKDSVLMDTVFSTVGSRTYDFWVYNRSRDGVRLSSVRLRQGFGFSAGTGHHDRDQIACVHKDPDDLCEMLYDAFPSCDRIHDQQTFFAVCHTPHFYTARSGARTSRQAKMERNAVMSSPKQADPRSHKGCLSPVRTAILLNNKLKE